MELDIQKEFREIKTKLEEVNNKLEDTFEQINEIENVAALPVDVNTPQEIRRRPEIYCFC